MIDYLSNLPGLTEMSEASIPILRTALEELGMEVEIIPHGFTKAGEVLFNDTRETHFQIWNAANNVDRLDPDEFTTIYSPANAGSNGQRSFNNWAPPDTACEYQGMINDQRRAASTEEREQIINEAHAMHSEDVATIPLITNATYGAYNTDEVDPGPIGAAGIANTSTHTLIQSSSSEGLQANVPSALTTESVFFRFSGPTALIPWSTIVYSPLFYYDEEYNFINMLADGYEYQNEGQSLRVDLRDATFHNGNQITSEDVAWTYNYLNSNRDVFALFPDVPLESIDTPDDSTVVFNLSERFTPFLTRVLPLWGIAPKDHFIDQGAEEDPAGFQLDTIIGSGPYSVDSLNTDQSILLSPHDGHPVYDPSSELSLIAYSDSQGATRAFENGDINWLQTISAGLAQQLRENIDFASVEITRAASNFLLWPQTNWGPSKHRAIRMAFSQAINRQRVNQTVAFGDSTPVLHSNIMAPTHPWWPGDDSLTQIADSASGSVETARSTLEDAGYTFADDGSLRYPADADLDPLWPQGQEPADFPDRYPCLE
jgi:peptide/nickel transport system substrate-binding protein